MAKEKDSNLSDLKSKQLDLAREALEKQFGKGILISQGKIPGVEFQSTGILSLDKALGGGIAEGRIIEVFGPESSGKTTLTLHAIAETQAAGKVAAFIDAEHAFDPIYAAALGVDMNQLIFSQPSSAEEALEVVDTLAKSGALSLIVIDSVAALVPQKELEGDMGDSTMGQQARLMGQAMRKLTGITAKNNCTLIFINQIRMKLGIMFGNPETTSGGNALKFYASQRIDVRRRGQIKAGTGDDAEVIGNETEVKVIKNKVAPPYKSCNFVINYGTGVDKEKDILTLAVENNIITKAGAGWYSIGDKKLGQGETNILNLLKTDSKFRQEILSKLQ